MGRYRFGGGDVFLLGGVSTPLHAMVMVIKMSKMAHFFLHFLLMKAKNESQVGENI